MSGSPWLRSKIKDTTSTVVPQYKVLEKIILPEPMIIKISLTTDLDWRRSFVRAN